MRPQHITAENEFPLGGGRRLQGDASMRPQHITAENTQNVGGNDGLLLRFNEAAAYHCGKQRSQRTL